MSGHFRNSRRSWARVACALALAAVTVIAPLGRAAAQSADDSGWFDDQPAGVPEPYYDPTTDPSAAGPEPEAPVDDTDPSALTTFRPALDPYGRWESHENYGTVWVPHSHVVGADFAPYVSGGHWAATADDDWIWVSDYPFGWAVFHYGRWVWIAGSGWAWVPGRTYANAWVVWRVPSGSYAYVGWAPMPPTWIWVNGGAVSLWYSPPLPYVFCPSGYLFAPHIHHHIVHDRHLVHRIARHTHVYPTPYRAPARPSVGADRPSARRTAAAGPSSAPRAPRFSAARIPPSAIPRERAAAPANASRLASARRADRSMEVYRPSQRAASPSSPLRPTERVQGAAAQPRPNAVPSGARSPSTSSSGASRRATEPRASAPERMRAAPARTRINPPKASAPPRARPAPRLSPSPARMRGSKRP